MAKPQQPILTCITSTMLEARGGTLDASPRKASSVARRAARVGAAPPCRRVLGGGAVPDLAGAQPGPAGHTHPKAQVVQVGLGVGIRVDGQAQSQLASPARLAIVHVQ